MTKSPSNAKVRQHVDAARLTALFDGPEFRKIRDGCVIRRTEPRFFPTGKPGHQTTVREWEEVYSDATGLRAYVFNYQQSDETVICSIKRVVTDEFDYCLPMPNATSTSVYNAGTTKSTT